MRAMKRHEYADICSSFNRTGSLKLRHGRPTFTWYLSDEKAHMFPSPLRRKSDIYRRTVTVLLRMAGATLHN